MTNKKKIGIIFGLALIAVMFCIFSLSISASTQITDAELTVGRSFEDSEAIQIGKDLTKMPKTYEAVVYVPADVTERGAIFSNYYPLGGVGHIDFSVTISGTNKEARPVLDIIDQNNNRTRVEFKKNIKTNGWVHVVITHQLNSSGDIFICYVNGEKVTSQNINYWVDGTKAENASITHNLNMAEIQESVSMYVGHAFGYSSATVLGSEDPYNYNESNQAYNEYIPTNFKGKIKNIALYSDVLTESEIKSNYNSGINSAHSDIILCYDLTEKETKSGYISDISGNGYDTIPLYHERTEELDPDDYDYSFAVLGDTQCLVNWDALKGTSYTSDIFNWIVANKDAKKIAHVIGVGDIVESGRLDAGVTDASDREHAVTQWELAASEYAKLEKSGIPYTITWGYNHDGYEGEEFTTYFGNSKNFSDTNLGYYFSDSTSADYNKRLANYYRTFEVCGVKYMILCIEYVPGDAVLSWADAVIKANPDRKVIITTHYFLNQHGEIASEYNGIQPKWDRLANENKNVEMILCGHIQRQANIVRAYTVAKSGQTVAQFLIDPQQMDCFYGYDDTGVVAMFYFSNNGEDVRVEFISTAKTMRAKEIDPNAEDVLYGRKNEFKFNDAGEVKPAGSMGEIDLYIIAGQSNAVGYGRGDLTVTDDRFTNGFENVLYYGDHVYYGSEDIDGFIPVKTGLGQGNYRSGAEIGIAYKLDDNGRRTVIIKCGVGATPLYPIEGNANLEQYGSWTPPSFIEKHPELVKHEMVGQMYRRLISTLTSGMDKLAADGYILNVKGVLWLQGEADTNNEYAASAYEELLTDLITDLRTDLSKISGKDCSHTPVAVGKITSNHINTPTYTEDICASQRAVAEKLNNVYVLDTTGLEQQDNWHYTAESQRIIGEKFIDIISEANGNHVTQYGTIPQGEYDPVNKPLAVFVNGDYISSFGAWDTALQYIKDTVGLNAIEPNAKTAQLLLLSDYTPSTYHNISQMGGTLIIDLNGFKLNVSSSVMNGNCKPISGKMCTTTVIFKNGDIIIGSKSITDVYVPENAVGDKTISYTFENVNFSFSQGATASVISIGSGNSKGSYKLYVDLTFNNCTFDLSTNAKSDAKLFALNKSELIGNIQINGGKIIKDTCTSGSLFSIDSADSVTFGKYNSKYTELHMPTGVTPAAEKFSSGDSGDLYFAKSSVLSDSDVYTLTEVTTKYGEIPTKYLSVEDYPFIVFVFNGNTLVSESTKGYDVLQGNDAAIDYAKKAITSNVYSAKNGYDGQLSAVILMRRDYTVGTNEIYYNHGQIRGIITYDLGGYTLSQSPEAGAVAIMHVQTKPTGNDVTDIAPSFIRIINGNMITYTSPVLTFGVTPSSNSNYTIEDKKFGITFENVNFSLGEGATATTLMFGYASSNVKPTEQDPNPMAKFDIEYKDCNINLFYNVHTSKFELFNLAPTVKNATSVNVKFYGGSVRCREWDGNGTGNNFKVFTKDATNGSTFYFEKSETTNQYLKLLMTPGAAAPSNSNVFYTSNGTDLGFVTVSNTGSIYVYTLKSSDPTKYGKIPASAGEATDYPFALFVYSAGSDTPVFVGVYAELFGANNGVFHVAKEQLKNNEWNNGYAGQIRAVILMRRDYTLGEAEYFSNIAQIRGEIILDLDGYTLSQYSSASAKPLFGITSKPWGDNGTADGHADVFPSIITIKNGSVLTYNSPVFKLGINSTSNTLESLSNKLFTINSENVIYGLKEGATTKSLTVAYNGGRNVGDASFDKDIAPFVFNFTDCIFDLSTVAPQNDMVIFDINSSDNYIKNTVNIIGGEIILKGIDDLIIVNDGANGSEMIFAKESEYTTLVLPAGVNAPSTVFKTDSGKAYFVYSESANKYLLTACTHEYDDNCDSSYNLCGDERDPIHNYSMLEHNAEEHWYKCVCGALDESSRQAHLGGNATCQTYANCEICNEAYGEMAEHSPMEDDGDCTTDIICSVCNTVTTAGAPSHIGDNATYTQKATCTLCHKEFGEMKSHADENADGICDGCSKALENNEPSKEDPNQPGDNNGNENDVDNDSNNSLPLVIIGAALILGAAAVCVIFFIKKRKIT